MKCTIFDRDKLEELVLKKVKEVNNEAGYRKYLEVPEMVEIVAKSIEEMLCADEKNLIAILKKEEQAIEQILGKALGYPWYIEDPKNFPNATEADGVCVGVETAWSLAMIAADKIKELEKKVEYFADLVVDNNED